MKRLTILRCACWCLSQSRPKLQNKIGLQGQSTLGCSGSGTNAHLSLPTSKVTEKKTKKLTIHQIMFCGHFDCHRRGCRKEKFPHSQQHACFGATALFAIAKSLDRCEQGVVGNNFRLIIIARHRDGVIRTFWIAFFLNRLAMSKSPRIRIWCKSFGWSYGRPN